MTMYDARNCVPIVDEENPFYCPTVTAQSFLARLRERLSSGDEVDSDPQAQHHDSEGHGALVPFDKLLDQSISEDDILDIVFRCPTLVRPSPEPEEDSSLDSIRSIPRHMRDNSMRRELKPPSIVSDTFSDLQGPIRHELSVQTVNEGSFQLSGKAERIQFFPPNPKFSASHRKMRKPETLPADGDWHAYARDLKTRTNMLQDDLFGPPIGTESPRGIKTLVARLDGLLPGIRLKEKLTALEAVTHQQIVDALASDGNLDSRTLNTFRQSEIECLDLTTSVGDDAGGLNLGARDLLQVLGRPNSFLFLRELSLNGVQLCEVDILHIHHLPRLARLWLGSTGIGNEVIFLLTALGRTLTDLDIAYNPRINDDAVPALLTMHKLLYLSLLDTSVTMTGVRRLAADLEEDVRNVEVEVPSPCEEYIRNLSQQYVVDMSSSSLITDPTAAECLSVAALKRNLGAHAEVNSQISTQGTKQELATRLKAILETRKADLLAQKLVWQLEEQQSSALSCL